jgi:hypothetical protein
MLAPSLRPYHGRRGGACADGREHAAHGAWRKDEIPDRRHRRRADARARRRRHHPGRRRRGERGQQVAALPALCRQAGVGPRGDRFRRRAEVTTLAGLQRWRDALVERNALREGRYGCPLGSLANEVADQDSTARDKLHDLFTAWQQLFEDLLRRFQRDGVLPPDIDVARLATGFVAAVQGGYLLAQTSRDAAPMAAAIDMALAHLRLLAGGATAGQAWPSMSTKRE